MTQEERNILLKDLCARFPYGAICEIGDGEGKIVEKLGLGGLGAFMNGTMSVKPYLRPMSSITKEEEKDFRKWQLNYRNITYDWFNAHHIDYRGLIEKGLAIAVTEENNPYKE